MKNKSLNIIIYILIFLIIGVIILLFTNRDIKTPTNNEETNNKPQETSILSIKLKGDKEITLIKGSEYKEPGYTAHDSIEGDLTNRVIIDSNLNTNIVGIYTITYRVTNSKNVKTETTRTIRVIEDLNITIDYNPKELTNTDVTVNIKVTGEFFDSIIDPNGNINKNKISEYKIKTNGEYLFKIKRTDGLTFEKNIKIDNIDKKKPTGSCKNTITTNNTTVIVDANDENGITKYIYKYNDTTKDLTTNKHIINKKISDVSVTIYDKAGNFETIKCKKIDDTWPVIKEQNYQTHSNNNYKRLKNGKMNYLIYYPDNLDLSKKHPLVIHLHGLGEFGSDINNTLAGSSAFANNMRQGKFQQQAIFLAPQCYSTSKKWTECFNDLKGLIDKVVKEYNVDSNRISMSGHSLGGQAVFDFIVAYPSFLAAAAPLSPSYPFNHDYSKMKDLKIAVFLGTEEPLYKKDQPEIEYLQKNGVNLKQFPLQGVTHSSQKAFYNGTNIIDWLISQSK